ncbi:maestro heat-like repeat family member 5 isoform X3 [Fukomys damarensis]|uniref:maestro heat-like repeat family member 5 isoform X3 n=1 Tax=Fukomys damarensis TaxID=885580 RepID=UPI0014552088|nr:maestro heat-like repeat family member 5 isoform X3 [Fukomys damarensis]
MDGQHSERPRSRNTADRVPSATSLNPRISSSVSMSMLEPSHMKAPQDSACRNQQAHPSGVLPHKSMSSQAALMFKDRKMFMEEAYNSAICFKMLRDIGSSELPYLQFVIKRVRNMAQRSPSLVMETIRDYFTDNPQISSRHKFRLFQVLENVIKASDCLEDPWRRSFIQLALDNMTKSTELEDTYQDAASNVLVAICRHSWQTVAQHLETELLTGTFPHRSLFYVMGILSSHEELLNQEDRVHWEELLAQIIVKSVKFLDMDLWSKELLEALTKPSQTQQEHPPEKAFLFTYYGLILQAAENSTTVRTHLQALLETSHQWPKQREGIALTVGLAATQHLDDVWAILDQFGRSRPVKWTLQSPTPKSQSFEDLQWKWASSTILLAYGQMAARAKTHILPWVDNILSRMIFYFRYSSWDETLKQSFLSAILMLVGAISRSEGAHSYEFSQTSQLLECLMVLMEKEPPGALCTTSRQQVIHIASKLCELRPPIDKDRKSRLLSTCFRSVFALPLMDTLERHTCLFLEPPNIQTLYSQTLEALDHMLQSFIMQSPTASEMKFLLMHLYPWLASEKVHERQRAAHSCMILLRFLNHRCFLDPKEDFRPMGQLIGMLGILCKDPDSVTQHFSLEGVGQLYQFLMHQKAEAALQEESHIPKELSQPGANEASPWSTGDQRTASSLPQKEIMKYLTATELTDLVWTVIEGLGSTSAFHMQAAAELLLAVIWEHGAKLETTKVANMGRAIHRHLCSVHVPKAKKNVLQAITLLARDHTSELVAAFLDFSMPLDSHALCLWKALGAEKSISRLVLAVLLAWLKERPLSTRAGNGNAHPKEKTYLYSLAAMNTLHELQFMQEFKKVMQEAYPQLLLALLTQIHYVLELNLPKAKSLPGQQAQEAALPSPQSTSLEALKSLLFTTGHWHDFAHLELQGAWERFSSIITYPQGVVLLARAMVKNHCRKVKAMLGQLLPSLQSQEERERKVAILIFNEFLYSPALLEVLPTQAARTVLAKVLCDPSPEVRVSSLQALGNILFHPEKESLLRAQLPHFLEGFFQKSEPVVVGIMNTMSEVLHQLGMQGAGAQSLNVAINVHIFFDDERDQIRAAAMALFGDLVDTMAGGKLSDLQTQVHQSMVPLLLHLKDQCPAVVTQAKFAFYRCAVLLRWQQRHILFCTLAWEHSLSARHFLWTCLMTRSQEEFSIHLAQALKYLHSCHHMMTWAILFIGYTICYFPQAMSQMLSNRDMDLLLHAFEDLKKDPAPSIQEFATRQLLFFQKVSPRSQK